MPRKHAPSSPRRVEISETSTSLRLPADLLARVDAAAQTLGAAVGVNVSRAQALRRAIELGIEAIEKAHGHEGGKSSRG